MPYKVRLILGETNIVKQYYLSCIVSYFFRYS